MSEEQRELEVGAGVAWCPHYRQNVPGRAEAMPCAFPGCFAGTSNASRFLILAIPPKPPDIITDRLALAPRAQDTVMQTRRFERHQFFIESPKGLAWGVWVWKNA